MGRKALAYKEYLVSDVWKCDKSPSGAHYWKELQHGRYSIHTEMFVCQHCGSAKRFPINYETTSFV